MPANPLEIAPGVEKLELRMTSSSNGVPIVCHYFNMDDHTRADSCPDCQAPVNSIWIDMDMFANTFFQLEHPHILQSPPKGKHLHTRHCHCHIKQVMWRDY